MGNQSEGKSVVKYEARDGVAMDLSFETVKKYLVQGSGQVSNQEMVFFLGVCKSRGLNPFKKDAYLIKYGSDPAAIVTSIDYFRSRARAQKDCTGWRKGIIVQLEDGTVKDSAGLILEGEKLVGGFFEATPHGWTEPFRVEVNLNSFVKKTKQGQITRFWSEPNQPMMIAKVAESQGLRTLWPDEFQGMYERDEIQPSEVSMVKVDGGYKAEDLSQKIKENSDEQKEDPKEKCPWPDCDIMCMPGKGMKSHITRQHDGLYPDEKADSMEDTQEGEIIENTANGIETDNDMKAEAEVLAKKNKENIEKIYEFRQDVKDEVYKRLDIKSPILANLKFETVDEILDLCHVVDVEIPEEFDEEGF